MDTKQCEWLKDPYTENRHEYGYQYPENHEFHDHHLEEVLGSVLYLPTRKMWAAHVPAFGRGQFNTLERAQEVVEQHVAQLSQ